MIREAREGRGWSQAYVARKVGVGRAAINKIELGKSQGGGGTLLRLLALLEIDPATESRREEGIAVTAQPERTVYPGVEALARNEQVRNRHGITDADLEYLRGIHLPEGRGIDSPEIAVMYLTARRLNDDLRELEGQ